VAGTLTSTAAVDADAVGGVRRLTHNRWFRRLVVWSVLAGLYEAAAYAAGPFFLPTLQAIVRGAVELAVDGAINTVWGAMLHMLLGFLLAVVVGVPLGVLMGASRLVDYVVGMYVKALFVTSLVAVLPLLIIFFGFGLAFRVAVVFLFAVFFIILNTATGVRDVDKQLLAMGHAFCASWLKRTVAIVLPSSVPFIVSGMRLGLANAFSGMILAELWITRDLGLVMTRLGLNRDLPKFFALVLIVTLIAAFSAAALKWVERRLTPWAAVRRGE
jgi:ABC-type nitrate/sulfonate/bicarbonate transport system permease component